MRTREFNVMKWRLQEATNTDLENQNTALRETINGLITSLTFAREHNRAMQHLADNAFQKIEERLDKLEKLSDN